MILRLRKDMVFQIKDNENTNIYIQCDLINEFVHDTKPIWHKYMSSQ